MATAPRSLLALLGLLLCGRTAAQVPLCLVIERPAGDPALEAFPRLVEEAVAHHRSHVLVEADCQALLRVELWRVEGVLHLTARVGQQVPVRYAVRSGDDLAERVQEAVALCLQNEPVYLAEDIAHLSFMERMGLSIGRRGRTAWRVEMFEVVSRAPHAVFATGGALGMSRGSGHWQLLARAYAAGSADRARGEDRALRALAGAEVGLAWESHEREDWTFYAGLSLGLQYLRFEGRIGPADGGRLEAINEVTGALGARLGFRFLRTRGFDLDLFVLGHLPVTATHDEDVPLWGDSGLYTPSLQLGLGVGF